MRAAMVAWIFRRELRDQLRDRRTLFMVVVLPLLLYPLIGLGVARMSPVLEPEPLTVAVVDADAWGTLVIKDEQGQPTFNPAFFETQAETRLLLPLPADRADWADEEVRREKLRSGVAAAAIVPPADFATRLEHQGLMPGQILISYDGADERGFLAATKARDVVNRWIDLVRSDRLRQRGRPYTDAVPFRAKVDDVATVAEAGGSVWAKLFPFLLVIMALTGAFYPAIDSCAGEKERGTMETLLLAPARRVEVVVGKFLMVMLASYATAMLNLLSLAVTGWQLARQIQGYAGPGVRQPEAILSAPSAEAMFWTAVLLVPLSGFFAALSLAVASLARSMKEGQYYMTPLYLAAIPLTMLAMMPGVELTFSLSVTPVTGPALLLRSLMQGEYAEARRFLLPVLLATAAYAVLALRWAVGQFRREEALFRDSERLELGAWLRHLWRDRTPRPTPTQAGLCYLLMVVLAWFLTLGLGGAGLTGLFVGQVGFLLGPPLLMAIFLTSDPYGTLRLRRRPALVPLACAGLLAVALNPLLQETRALIERLMPVSETIRSAVEILMEQLPGLGLAVLALAVLPAVCEEVAFRGYILSGLASRGRVAAAVVGQAVLFGLIHALLSVPQQFPTATALGLVLGLIAVRTGSLWPPILFHVTNNGLSVALGMFQAGPDWMFRDRSAVLFRPEITIGATLIAALLLAVLATTKDTKGSKEKEEKEEKGRQEIE